MDWLSCTEILFFFFFSSRRRHTRSLCDWSSDVCSSDLLLGGLTRSVRKAWHIYPVGVLFGLGFDTATEVGLLVLAGGAAAFNLPFYSILVLPVLFAAGMCLLDTVDGVFMNAAYGWAFAKPVRKIFYNITITSISVAVALVIGTVELLGVLADQAHITSGPVA